MNACIVCYNIFLKDCSLWLCSDGCAHLQACDAVRQLQQSRRAKRQKLNNKKDSYWVSLDPTLSPYVKPTHLEDIYYTEVADALELYFKTERPTPPRPYTPFADAYPMWDEAIRLYMQDEPLCLRQNIRRRCTTDISLDNTVPYPRNKPDLEKSYRHRTSMHRAHLWIETAINWHMGR